MSDSVTGRMWSWIEKKSKIGVGQVSEVMISRFVRVFLSRIIAHIITVIHEDELIVLQKSTYEKILLKYCST